MKHIKTVYGILISTVVAPLVAFAQNPSFQQGFWPTNNYGVSSYGQGGGFGNPYGQTRSGSITNFQQIITIIQTLLGYMQILVFVAAIFFFLKAAFHFVTGDPGTGSKTLGWAVIGVIIGLLSFTIIPFICFLTQSGGPACGL